MLVVGSHWVSRFKHGDADGHTQQRIVSPGERAAAILVGACAY